MNVASLSLPGLVVIVVGALLLLVPACGSGECSASCPASAIQIGPPGESGPAFTVSLSGTACGPADLSCQSGATPQTCGVQPHAAGTCLIVVRLASGAVSSTTYVTVTDEPGPCCGGVYPDRTSIDVSG